MEDLAKKFQRLLGILQQLSVPGGCSPARISTLYGVSVRTIQRDLNDLKDACFDIQLKGRKYYLESNIPTQTLHLPEVLSLALGSSLMGAEATSSIGELTQRALVKLQAFVKGDKKLKMRDFTRSVVATDRAPDEAWFPDLMRAIAERHCVLFSYQGLSQARPEPRSVEPWTLLLQSGAWYLQGLDHDRKEARTFRLNRMRDFEVTQRTFKIPPQHQADSVIFHRWDLSRGKPRKVICRATPELLRWLEENPVHPTQKIYNSYFEIVVGDMDKVAAWVLSLTGMEVVQPSDLRRRVRERASELAEAHR